MTAGSALAAGRHIEIGLAIVSPKLRAEISSSGPPLLGLERFLPCRSLGAAAANSLDANWDCFTNTRHERQPSECVVNLSLDDFEEAALNQRSNWAAASIADGDSIH